ncbi:MAG: phosphoenolpyruvate hydrolase family protein [Bacillota bacterium]|nr:phosphoenolpyruvate hydrolase family protein [Bacillota bacterium]
MGKRYTCDEVVARLKNEIANKRSILLVGVGNGIVAKMCELGGVDLIATYIMARYRMAGHSSMLGYLSIGDANAVALELGEREVIPVVKETPVIAGLLGCDVTRDLGYLLDQVKAVGFSGIHNCPTLALIDGVFRQVLEETGIKFDREVEMVRLARERDLFCEVFVTNEEETEKMVKAGANLIIAHMGNSLGGTIGSDYTLTLDESVERTQKIIDAARAIDPEVITMCHGGPIAYLDDFKYVLSRVKGLDGFMGGSSVERLPVEKSLLEVVREYKSVTL